MFSQKKPYSAVTVTIENLTAEAYEEDDLSGIPDLVEVIKLQATGPAEAARALRKKLKYGSVHRQLRTLTLLDGLIQNAGPRFQRAFLDEPLLERLRVCGTSDLSDPDVRKKCSVLFRGWAATYKNTPGLERLARLYKELPQRKHVVTQAQSRVVQETANPFGDDEDEADSAGGQDGGESSTAATAGPSSSSSSAQPQQPPPADRSRASSFLHDSSRKKDKDKDKAKKAATGKKKTRKPFNLEAEKGVMKAAIADASIATTDLMNALQTINREQERISENETALRRFEACKLLRRKILRYIYLVDSEDWLGSLLRANDDLVTALMTFEQLDRSIDADSDSEDDMAEQAHRYRMMAEKAKEPGSPTSPTSPRSPVSEMAGLSIGASSSGPGAPIPPAPVSPPPLARSPQSIRPAAPPRPPPASKPLAALLATRSSARATPGPPPARPAAAAAAAAAAAERGGDSDGGDSYRDEDEDDDPFADHNAVTTPKVEKDEPRW